MIREATGFNERAQAVEFATRIVRPDISRLDRQRRALTYAAQSDRVAVDAIDAEPNGGLTICRGTYPAPIYVYFEDSEIVGVAVCSCDVPGLPLRIMMLGVAPDRQGHGIGGDLVAHVIASTPVVGVAVQSARLRRYYEDRGFHHWRDGASGDQVGFTKPIDHPSFLYFTVPASLSLTG